MIDYHLHTALCGHAVGDPSDYLEAARNAGLKEIGFAEHFPLELLGIRTEKKLNMSLEELPLYIQEIKMMSKEEDPAVRLGVEVDYIPGCMDRAAGLLAEAPLDFVTGSVHFLGNWDFTNPRYRNDFHNRDHETLYRNYFHLVWEACASGLFDIVGHIDVIKKFGLRPPPAVGPLLRETAAVLRETGVCLELNTAGIDAPVRELYPGRDLLCWCRRAGVPVTLGSDAHKPAEVSRHFPAAFKALYEAGYRSLTVFKDRCPRRLPFA